MALLVDADVIIQAERKAFDFDAWLRAHPDEEIKLAAITVAELWRSVERATGVHRARRQKFLQSVLACLKSFRIPRRQPLDMRAFGPTWMPQARELARTT